MINRKLNRKTIKLFRPFKYGHFLIITIYLHHYNGGALLNKEYYY